MKNVLLITNIYPNNDPDYGGTLVCHSFTKEWQSMGYNVRVIHFESLFPRIFYFFGKIFNKYIQAKTGNVAYTKTPKHLTTYEVEGIPVIFAPLKKYIPHKIPSNREMDKIFESVCRILVRDGFIPDVVTGHFVQPQLEMLYRFKQRYSNIKTCMVLHDNGSRIATVYPDSYKSYMDSVDLWGFRSYAFKKQFENIYGVQKKEFLCYSGVPERYLTPINRSFANGVRNFVFLGSLYKLKNVDITLRALNVALHGRDYHFDVVGSGAEDVNLHKLAKELNMEGNVTFHGRMNRDDAQKVLEKADCFIMVSSHEAFGLVYVEAMAKGLITVATEGQGIDGVIINGKNGFLCPSQDVESLALKITEICSMPENRLNEISQNALSAALEMSDRKVAERYINALFSTQTP